MPRHMRWRRIAGFLTAFAIVFSIQMIWTSNNVQQPLPTRDPKLKKLLLVYQSNRSKKRQRVVYQLPGNDSQPLHHRIQPVMSTSRSNISVLEKPQGATSITDIFIAVKSSGKFHTTRLPLLLDTWIPLAKKSTFLITDVDDPELMSRFEPGHYQMSTCPQSHYRKGLVCKVSLAYDLFMLKQRRWFCIVDDDTYINIPNLVATLQKFDSTLDWYIGRPSLKYPIRVTINNLKESFWFHTGGAGYCISRALALKMSPHALGGKLRELADTIRVPDDVAVGYIINKKLGVDITRMLTFHSHLEGLWRISPHDLRNQVTLSYGEFETGPNHVISNVINLGKTIPTFPPPYDPTRLRSLHCYLFPGVTECEGMKVAIH
ncbi:beta-1,3-N-acetylglucosaminyltransferase radical fringe-like [Watersipora subatra]|uniref:beta-1,3-N-acetylglucosaminyltransferase radical fringe-like n=1 Tax=Watersipora subatra TaxID=2589382 RepID=UPI00355BC5F4